MAVTKTKEWSRAQKFVPKDNLTTEAGLRAQKHVMESCIDKDDDSPPMSLIIGMEYGRMWLREREKFVKQHAKIMQSKVIKNDFEWWLKQRKTTKKFCGNK
ncbi:CG31816 [Drosophila busckii]|uniref:CG31816 n=1 Tax=Drosophila busckii TaxID=30019 RepID=A0A0M4EGP9_DROBS|nr:uncharacterized protein LOC108596443 [Drosophila busckii]ALC41622.1 CG31816 [Drosophila busckii]